MHPGKAIFRDPRKFWEATYSRDGLNQIVHRRKIAGLDLSPRRIGIAVSDDIQEFALPIGVFHVRRKGIHLELQQPNKPLIQKMRCEANSIAGWVVGWPLTLAGEESYRTEETLTIIEQCQILLGIQFENILLHDERYSTILARSDSLDQPKGHQVGLDALAASRILQEYLDLSSRQH
ncbi:hypothetical protein PSACC_01555 [Paramicrosporidium saccamoebae]|uniref:Pre-16S rRNA nuclease n=1 Tax=Paramicrosporidium saccamoebae TaxID=1246581 RepID=A0A2H9TLV2_9FUNG|nr:hypothetical protein PSACC_01555 [Paramicrosporidium saccamoebae]